MAVFDAHPDAGVAHGDAIIIDADGRETGHWTARQFGRRALLDMLFFGGNHIISPTAAVHRAAYDACGGYEPSLPIAGDIDFWLRAAATFGFRHIGGGPVVRLRRHGANYSDESQRDRELEQVEQAVRRALAALLAARPRGRGGLGRAAAAGGRAPRAPRAVRAVRGRAVCRTWRPSCATQAAAEPAPRRSGQPRPHRAHLVRLQRPGRRHRRAAPREPRPGRPRLGRDRLPRRRAAAAGRRRLRRPRVGGGRRPAGRRLQPAARPARHRPPAPRARRSRHRQGVRRACSTACGPTSSTTTTSTTSACRWSTRRSRAASARSSRRTTCGWSAPATT